MLTKTNKCKLNNRQHVGIKPFSRCTAESEIGSSSLCKYSTAYVIMQAESEAPSFKQAALYHALLSPAVSEEKEHRRTDNEHDKADSDDGFRLHSPTPPFSVDNRPPA